MMNYTIKRTADDYQIVERDTSLVVRVCPDVSKAQIVKTHLNRGGGFDGWTPAFILQSGKTILEKSSN